MRTARSDAIDIFNAGVRAAEVPSIVPLVSFDAPRCLRVGDLRVPVDDVRRVVVVGAGKAAESLCAAVVPALHAGSASSDPPDFVVEGLLLVPERLPPGEVTFPPLIPLDIEVLEVRPRDANAPTDAAVAATRRVLEIARGLGPDDVLLCLLSGGGSATLCAPAAGLTLSQKHEAVRLLTADGATIEEINTLRRHLSAVKGGRLAQAASGARAVLTVMISDVDGDRPHVIASGPTVPDPTTFREALDLREEWPPEVLAHLQAGCAGTVPETPDQLPAHVGWQVLRSPDDALHAAAERAAERGWRTRVLPRPTPSSIAACIAAHEDAVRGAPPGTAILSIGEAPFALPAAAPDGGRAGHLALALGLVVDADPALRGRVTVLVGATDGEDGTSGSSGGVVDTAVLRRAEERGTDPGRLLQCCDSRAALEAGGGLLPRRATGTNVQDLRVVLVGTPPSRETA